MSELEETKRNETKEGAETGSRKREEALEAMHEAYHTITMEEVPQWPCRCCRSLAAVFDSRNARNTTRNNTRQETRTLKWFVPEGCAGQFSWKAGCTQLIYTRHAGARSRDTFGSIAQPCVTESW